MPKLGLIRKGFLLFATPLLFDIGLVWWLATVVEQEEHIIKIADRDRQVMSDANELSKLFYDDVYSLVLYKVTSDTNWLDLYATTTETITKRLSQIREIASSEASLSTAAEHLSLVVNEALESIDQYRSSKLVDPTRELAVRQRIGDIAGNLVLELNKFIQSVKNVDRNSPQRINELRVRLKTGLIGAVIFNLSFLGLISMFYTSLHKRLLVLLQNIRNFSTGKELCPLVTGNDEVTELDGAFHSMTDELARVSEYKRQLIGIVSHELKAPLSGVNSFLALLTDGVYGTISDTALARAKGAEENTNRLISMVDDLLDIEKLESGKLEVNTESCEIHGLISKALVLVDLAAEENSIQMDHVLSEPAWVVADEGRIVQVVTNILSNAIKFSPPGSTVSIAVGETASNEIKVTISDAGPGLPEEARQAVFQRFVRLNDKIPGSGLGLAICKMIIDAHHGQIGVEPKQPTGCIFWFTLPRTHNPPSSDS